MSGRTIGTDPFLPPPEDRDPVRRLRGRLRLPVTVWTAGPPAARTGLTVSSTLVAEGEPGEVLGLLGDLNDIVERIEGSERFVVHLLGAGDVALADRFARRLPAPGGVFAGLEVEDTAYGPVLATVATRASCRLLEVARAGYQLLIRGAIDDVTLGDEHALGWYRGRYERGDAG